jgi:hypothetical protein
MNKKRTYVVLSRRSPLMGKTRASLADGDDSAPKLVSFAANQREMQARIVSENLLKQGFHELLGGGPGDECASFGVALSSSWKACASTKKSLCIGMLASEAQEHGQLYGHGLAALGVAAEKTVMVTGAREKDLLWTLEEALTSGAFGAVVGALGKEERLYAFSQRAIASIMRLTASRCRMSSPASARNARSAKPATDCSAMPNAI